MSFPYSCVQFTPPKKHKLLPPKQNAPVNPTYTHLKTKVSFFPVLAFSSLRQLCTGSAFSVVSRSEAGSNTASVVCMLIVCGCKCG